MVLDLISYQVTNSVLFLSLVLSYCPSQSSFFLLLCRFAMLLSGQCPMYVLLIYVYVCLKLGACHCHYKENLPTTPQAVKFDVASAQQLLLSYLLFTTIFFLPFSKRDPLRWWVGIGLLAHALSAWLGFSFFCKRGCFRLVGGAVDIPMVCVVVGKEGEGREGG